MNEILINWPIVLTPWKIIGYVGATMFASRWIVQLVHSRRAGRPVTPRIFWVMSIVGSLMTLAYFAFSSKQDSVGVMQNLFPCVIAGYNLYLDLMHEKKVQAEKTLTAEPLPAVIAAAAPAAD